MSEGTLVLKVEADEKGRPFLAQVRFPNAAVAALFGGTLKTRIFLDVENKRVEVQPLIDMSPPSSLAAVKHTDVILGPAQEMDDDHVLLLSAMGLPADIKIDTPDFSAFDTFLNPPEETPDADATADPEIPVGDEDDPMMGGDLEDDEDDLEDDEDDLEDDYDDDLEDDYDFEEVDDEDDLEDDDLD